MFLTMSVHVCERPACAHLNDSLVQALGLLQVQEDHLHQIHACFACFAVGHANLPNLLDQHLSLPFGDVLVAHLAARLEDPGDVGAAAHAGEVSFEVCLILQAHKQHTRK